MPKKIDGRFGILQKIDGQKIDGRWETKKYYGQNPFISVNEWMQMIVMRRHHCLFNPGEISTRDCPQNYM